MKPEGHQEIYRIAYDAASSELTEISAEVERLRLRKEQVERLISVLRPVIGEEEQGKQSTSEASIGESVESLEPVAVASSLASAEPVAMTADPFQRRIDHVLGIGAGIRDVRKYTRQF